jgi:hypothetical protein
LAVARVLGGFELLEHMLARQQEAFSLALDGNLGGSQWRRRWPGRRNCLSLLFLDRLALPSSRHGEIIPSQVVAAGLFICKNGCKSHKEIPDAMSSISPERENGTLWFTIAVCLHCCPNWQSDCTK